MRRILLLLLVTASLVGMLVLALVLREGEAASPLGGALVEPRRHAEEQGAVELDDAAEESAELHRAAPTDVVREAQVHEASSTVRVRVVQRGTQRPLENARIRSSGSAGPLLATTNPDGIAAVRVDASLGSIVLWVESDRHLPSRCVAPTNQGETPLFVELTPSHSVRGRVVDAEGVDVPGAEVLLGVLKRDLRLPPSVGIERNVVFPVDRAAEEAAGVHWELDAGAPAQVIKERSRSYSHWVSTRTGADGKFELHGVEHPNEFAVQIRAGARGVFAIDKSAAADAGDVDLGTLQLGRGAVLSGRAIDNHVGDPKGAWVGLANVRIVAESPASETHGRRFRTPTELWMDSVRTDASGWFRIEGLVPDEYSVRGLVPDESGREIVLGFVDQPARIGRVSREVVDLHSSLAAEVVLATNRTITLRGRVLTSEREPARGATLTATFGLERPSTTADSDGRFALSGLGRVPVTLTVGPKQRNDQVLPDTVLEGLIPSTTELEIVLSRAEWIAGRVLDATHRPVDRAQVIARSTAGAWLGIDTTTSDGSFRLCLQGGAAVDLDVYQPGNMLDGRTDSRTPRSLGGLRGVLPGFPPVEIVLPSLR